MEAGFVIADRFEVERLAGTGGMGAVYRAFDREARRPVALKLVPPFEALRFEREVQILAELRHPAIVGYVAHGRTTGGALYLAMEWLEGEDLAEHLAKGALPTVETLTLARRVTEALIATHARGVVHRDIKPSNVFLPARVIANATLLDFGVARLSGTTRMATRIGTTVGTPGYMAPEQAKGAKDLDGRADIFSLGCVLFECVTGHEAFSGEDVAAIFGKILLADTPRPSLLSPAVLPELDQLITRMLAKDPRGRPASAQALKDELDAILSGAARPSAARSSSVAAVTTAEQRYVSIIFSAAKGGAGAAREQTLSPDELGAIDPREELAKLGARYERLLDGSAIATVTSEGLARDQAAIAGRCALFLKAADPAAVVVVATGRAVVDGPLSVGEVIDRATALARPHGHGRSPEGIPVDVVTARLLRERFLVRQEGPRWLLLAEKGEAAQSSALQGQPTAFVGREDETRILKDAVKSCITARAPAAYVVTGPPGAGKSRLAREVLRQLPEEGVRTLLSRGDPVSHGSPFAVVAQVLRAAMGLGASESILERQSKISQHVSRLLPAAEAPRVTEFLGEIAGAPFADMWSEPLRAARQSPVLMGDQMRRAWEDWIDAFSGAGPLLLLLEDLQWGDRPSLELLIGSLLRLEERPLFLLGVARSEVRELFPSIFAEPMVTELPLSPLSRAAALAMTHQVLGEENLEDAGELIDRAEGNAFFLEELLRARASGETDPLPETVVAVAQARLEKLSPSARRVLRAASVFGESFCVGGIASLLGGAATVTLPDDLGHLLMRDIVFRQPESRLEGQEELAFRHTLMREAAYASLPERDRVVSHGLAGKWLEQAGESDALLLAEHFERGGEPVHAVRWFLRAAEHALEGSDLDACVTRAARGIRSGAAGETLGRFELLEAEARGWLGDLRGSRQHARQAMKLLTPGSARWYNAVAELAKVCGWLGHTQKVVDVAEVLSAWDPQDDARSACTIAAATTTVALYYAGRFELATTLLARTRALGPTSAVSRAWVRRAEATGGMMAGEPAMYLVALEESAASFEEAGDRRSACTLRVHLGHGQIAIGAYALAEACLRSALETAHRMKLVSLEMSATNHLGFALLGRGLLDEARKLETEALAFFSDQGDKRLEGAALTCLAMILAAGGDPAGSEREAKRAVAALESLPTLRVTALATLARAELGGGRAADGLATARQACAILQHTGASAEAEAALARLVYAEALLATGDAEGAGSVLSTARARLLARAERITDPVWRTSFLEAVPEHRETLALAGRHVDVDYEASTVS